jgi:hypothetical protein
MLQAGMQVAVVVRDFPQHISAAKDVSKQGTLILGGIA